MNKKHKQVNNDIQGIANLIQYGQDYPQGAVKIGYHYYNIKALTDALQDIKTRSAMGASTKADSLLMQILAGVL